MSFYPLSSQKTEQLMTQQIVLKLLTWNILGQRLTCHHPYCNPKDLEWNSRFPKILGIIESEDADVLCFQEVQQMPNGHASLNPEHTTFDMRPQLLASLSAKGYESRFSWNVGSDSRVPRHNYSTLGNVVSWRTSKYEIVGSERYFCTAPWIAQKLNEEMDFKRHRATYEHYLTAKESAIFVRLCEKSTGIQFVVVSTHITHRYYLPDLQCAEIVAILADLAKFVQPTDMAVFFGGDFNCIPGSLPYLLITQGSVDAVPKTEGVRIPRFLLPPHIQFVFESSYRAHRGTEPDCTTKTEDFEGVLDYIWFSANGTGTVKAIDTKLTATTVLQNIEKGNPIPSATYPSDHLHLVASFLIQRQ